MLESRPEADTLSHKWVLEPEVDTPQEQWLNNRTNVEDQSKMDYSGQVYFLGDAFRV